MNLAKSITVLLGFVMLATLQSCIWAKRCPQPSCRVSTEHRHEGGIFRPRAAFSWVYTKKHLPFSTKSGAKNDAIHATKANRKAKQPKFRYLLPGESLGKPKQ